MPTADQMFGASSTTATGNADQMFGPQGGQNAQEPATSPLASNRAVLPKKAEEKGSPSTSAETVGAPTPQDIQRNAVDLGRQGRARQFLEQAKGEEGTAEKLGQGFALGEVPGVGTAVKAFAGTKVGQAIVTPITNKAAGISQAFSGSKLGTAIGQLSDDFYKTTRMVYERRAEWLKDITNYKPKDWDAMKGKVDDFLEGSITGPLTKAEQKMVTNIQMMNAKTSKMREQVKALGYDVGPDEPGYIGSRLSTEKPSMLQSIASSAPTGKAKGISAFAPEFKPRVVHGLEGNGEKDLHMIDNGNGTFTVWRNKQKITGGKFDADELKKGQVSFSSASSQKAGYGAPTSVKQTFNIVPSTKRAIEEHTNIQYYHDPLLSAVTANMHISEALNAAQFLEKLKFTPELQALRTGGKTVIPDGYRGVDVPQLAGYKFPPKVADVIDDFALPARTGGFKALNDLSRMAVGSMFWNPLPHAFNVDAFAAVQAGLIGTAKQLGHPVELVQSIMKAHNEVMNIGPAYRAAVREGAGLQYNAIFARDFVSKMAKQLGSDPEMGAAAKAWGYANPAEMWRRVMDTSAKHLWSWNDTMLMQGYFAKQAKGASLPQAIKDVESIIPSYRAPSSVLGSRTAAQIWQVLPTFARYHWGILKAYGNMASGLVAGNGQEKMQAIDRLAMLALGSTVVYPAMDHAIQKASGNPDARLRRFGPFAPIDAVYRFASGDARYATLSGAMLGISPIFSVPTAIAEGEDPFTGKKFETWRDAAKFIGEQFNPIQTAAQYEGLGGRKTGGELLAEQFGIQLPSDKEVAARDKARARNEKKRAKEEEE